ncbi:MAG: TonB-dependent receptor [Gemmatimonadota bacterium]
MGPEQVRLITAKGGSALRSGLCRAGALVVLLAAPGIGAQERPDTVDVSADTLRVRAIPDSLRVVNLPSIEDATARRPERAGVWLWNRGEILFAPGLTLADLLRDVPGLRVVQGGDYGAPAVPVAFSATAGRIRVLQDGIELVPLGGDVVDLSEIGLAGLESVRVERSPGGIEIALTSRRFQDPRPYTQIEAGTGDLETNFFRGTFALPRAPGGSLLLTLDRVDTRGRSGDDNGSVNGVLARYTLAPSDRFGGEVTLLKRSVTRSFYPPAERDRTDWLARLRAMPSQGLTLGAFAGSARLSTSDSLETPQVRQLGLEAGWAGERVQVGVSGRRLDGEGLPTWTLDGEAAVESTALGGASVHLRRESWEGEGALRSRAAAWTAPRFGFSAFAELDRGRVGVPYRGFTVAGDSAFAGFPRTPRFFDERDTRRLGAAFERGGVLLRGARVSVDVDSLARFGLAFDEGSSRVAGGKRMGWDVEAHVPLLVFDGLSARGSVVRWDDEEAWPYTPRLQYDARVLFHDTFLPTGNFELLVEGGVREREPMNVFVAEEAPGDPAVLATVPFQQSWFARLHIRIVSVQLFVIWENLTLRRENQDFPERLLPLTRAAYGVRWGLWN